MIDIKINDFICHCEQLEDNTLALCGYEGNDAILDLSETNISVVERKAFLSCKSIKQIIFPDTIKFLGDWSFSKCASLKKVTFKGNYKQNLFGRGVFEGCSNIECISFQNASETLEILLAATTNRLYNEHLLRSDDVGEKSWYEKWDMALLSLLSQDDAEGSIDASVCGEEDTSYSGMVDGEMPGNESEYIKNAGKNKCFLCFERLFSNEYLEEDTRKRMEEYILERNFSLNNSYAWLTLKEDCSEKIDFYQIYLDIVKPDTTVINQMIADLSATQIQIKAFLIEKASGNNESDSFFDDLLF